MKHASYRHACWWIAVNDSAGQDPDGEGRDPRTIAYYVTSLLVADVFGVEPERVGEDVARLRKKFDKEGWPK